VAAQEEAPWSPPSPGGSPQQAQRPEYPQQAQQPRQARRAAGFSPPRAAIELPDGVRLGGIVALAGLLIEVLGLVIFGLAVRGNDLVSVLLVGGEMSLNFVAISIPVLLWLSWRRRTRRGTPYLGRAIRMAGVFRGEATLFGSINVIAAIFGLAGAATLHSAGERAIGLWAALYSVTGGTAVVILLAYSLRRIRRVVTAAARPRR
jgi:hypothetical protein